MNERDIRKVQKLFLIIFATLAIFTASAFVKMKFDVIEILKSIGVIL